MVRGDRDARAALGQGPIIAQLIAPRGTDRLREGIDASRAGGGDRAGGWVEGTCREQADPKTQKNRTETRAVQKGRGGVHGFSGVHIIACPEATQSG